PTALTDVDWLVDPAGTDPSSPVFQLIGKLRVPDRRALVLPSQTAALAAAADDDAGIAPAVTHLAAGEVRRNSVGPVDVTGLPSPRDITSMASGVARNRRRRVAAGERRSGLSVLTYQNRSTGVPSTATGTRAPRDSSRVTR